MDAFGVLEAFISINIVPCASCGQGKAKFLQQESDTLRAKRKNFGPLPLKCQWIRPATSLPQKIL